MLYPLISRRATVAPLGTAINAKTGKIAGMIEGWVAGRNTQPPTMPGTPS